MIVGNHVIDELGDSRFARARSFIAGNNEVGQPLHQSVFLERKKLEPVGGGLDLQRAGWRV